MSQQLSTYLLVFEKTRVLLSIFTPIGAKLISNQPITSQRKTLEYTDMNYSAICVNFLLELNFFNISFPLNKLLCTILSQTKQLYTLTSVNLIRFSWSICKDNVTSVVQCPYTTLSPSVRSEYWLLTDRAQMLPNSGCRTPTQTTLSLLLIVDLGQKEKGKRWWWIKWPLFISRVQVWAICALMGYTHKTQEPVRRPHKLSSDSLISLFLGGFGELKNEKSIWCACDTPTSPLCYISNLLPAACP